METLLTDLRFASRQLRKSPGFTAVASLTLALAIAVNSTMFSLVSGFLLQSPPGRDPNRVAVISSVNPNQLFHADAWTVSVPNYLAWRKTNNLFEGIAAADEDRAVSLGTTGSGQPESLHAAAVSPNYFLVLGAAPQIGRTFLDNEDQPGRDHVLILGHDLWLRHFGSDPSIVGRTIRLNREDWTVIGIMPKSFRMLGYIPELWIPLTITATDQSPSARNSRSLTLFARLKPGMTVQQASAAMGTLALQAQREFPETEKGWGAVVRTLPNFLIYNFDIRTGLILVMTAVGFILVIGCANVAGLLLARSTGRQKEISIRVSLGAKRLDIVRQLLAEGCIIAILGGAAGILLSNWGIHFVRASLNFAEVMSAVPLRLDRNVLLFTLGISVLSAFLCSLAPALKASRSELSATLNEESRGSSSGRSQSRLRQILVTGELALALFLLIGTGLLIQGLLQVEHQNLGFQPKHLLTAGLTLDRARYADASQRRLFVQNLLARLQAIPGSEAVAVASDLPATGPDSVPLRIDGQPDSEPDRRPSALDVVVTSDYFKTASIPLLRGRRFTEMDNADAPHVVVVNQEFVHRFLASQDPLGKRIKLELSSGTTEWSQIVGVVGNVKTYSEEVRYDPEVYQPYSQRPVPSFSIMVQATGDPGGLSASLRQSVAQIDGELPLARVMTMPALIELQKAGNPFFMHVMSSFALFALLLAAIGIYGLIAYSVARRTHEIGIRMALGAKHRDVLGMILRESLTMAAIGATVGTVVALPLPRIFEASFNLLGFHFREPGLYFAVPALILLVALLAAYVPARRAAKIDPMVALRYE
ncbi:MAG: ABC transporter permease [Acidobacteriaceae bacterium]|nr:ABC transporter permease [Acidobacteriaceae bacterium]